MRHFHRGPVANQNEPFRLWEWREVRGILGALLTTALAVGLLAVAIYAWWRSSQVPPDKGSGTPAAPTARP